MKVSIKDDNDIVTIVDTILINIALKHRTQTGTNSRVKKINNGVIEIHSIRFPIFFITLELFSLLNVIKNK